MAQRWGLDVAQALRWAEQCALHGGKLAGIWPEVFSRPAASKPVDVDEDLYGGFLDKPDKGRLERLRKLPPDDAALARAGFDDPRLAELVFRWRARNFAHTLTEAEQQRWQQHCAARLHEGAGGAQTLAAFFERVDALHEEADERGQALLEALYDYAEQIAPPPA